MTIVCGRAAQRLLAVVLLLALVASAKLTHPTLPDFPGIDSTTLLLAPVAAESAPLAGITDSAAYDVDADVVLVMVLVSPGAPENAYAVFFSCDQKVAYWFSHVGQLPLGLCRDCGLAAVDRVM